MIYIHKKKDARATKIDISFKCSATFIGSQVPHSSGKANLMNSAFVKVTLRTDFVHKAVDYCNVSDFDLDFGN